MEFVESKIVYRDKNGKQIKSGMKLKHDSGEVDTVIAGDPETGDLGFDANNPNYPYDQPPHIYPLHQFDLSEWEIME